MDFQFWHKVCTPYDGNTLNYSFPKKWNKKSKQQLKLRITSKIKIKKKLIAFDINSNPKNSSSNVKERFTTTLSFELRFLKNTLHNLLKQKDKDFVV
jgi:hypothetical protein